MKKLIAVLLALALLGAMAMAEEIPVPTLEPTPEPTQTPRGIYLPPLSEAFITPEPTPTPTPTPEPTPEPTPDPVEVARQALIAQVTGDWYLNAFMMDGTAYAPEMFGTEMTLSLQDEGAAAVDYGGTRKGGAGQWDVREERILVTIDSTTREFAYDEEADTLSTDIEGGSMVLGREKLAAEAFEPAEAVSSELEAFAGEWRTYRIGVDGTFYDIALFGQEITATIEDCTIAVTGYVFTGLSAQAEYVDGSLRFTGADDEGGMFDGVTATLLSDDSLRLELKAGDAGGFTLIMQRVEPR